MHSGKIPAQTNQSDAATTEVSHRQGQATDVDDIQAARDKPAGFNATIAAATAGTLVGLLLARRPR